MDQPIEFVIRASQPDTVEALREYAARRLSFLLRRFEPHIRRITVRSTHSDAAVAEVAARPWPDGTDIRVLTVVHATAPLVLDPAFVMAAIHVEQTKEQLQHAPDIVAAAKEQIVRGSPGINVSTKILEGVPRDVIVEEAREWDADLIVVGSHGYGRVKRLVLGSVAAAVVASTP